MDTSRNQASTVLVVIPTFNEADNISRLVLKVLEQGPGVDVLVVDDSSPDGTAQLVRTMKAESGRIHLLERPTKLGLGSAYVTGFKYALQQRYEFILEMDADFSHDPREIPNFLAKMSDADLVLGSRYIQGVRVLNWPIRRLMLSYGANVYTRIMTNMPVVDATGGFKCFRRAVLEAIDLDNIRSNGYAFQIEMSFKAWKRGFRVAEIPITFLDRAHGRSKMSKQIIYEALYMLWKLRLQSTFRRL